MEQTTEDTKAATDALEQELLAGRKLFQIPGSDRVLSVRYPTVDEQAEAKFRENAQFAWLMKRRGPHGSRLLTNEEVEREMLERGIDITKSLDDDTGPRRKELLEEIHERTRENPEGEDTGKIDALISEIVEMDRRNRERLIKVQQDYYQMTIQSSAAQEGNAHLTLVCTEHKVGDDGEWKQLWKDKASMGREAPTAHIAAGALQQLMAGVQGSFFAALLGAQIGDSEQTQERPSSPAPPPDGQSQDS